MSLAAIVALQKAELLVVKRLTNLQGRLQVGDESAWAEFMDTIQALVALLQSLQPENRGAMLTTQEMAARFGISPKTLLRRKAQGDIQPALQKGKLVRWSGSERLR
jgi:hypothetical protein